MKNLGRPRFPRPMGFTSSRLPAWDERHPLLSPLRRPRHSPQGSPPPPNPPFSTSPFLATLRLLPRPALPLLNCNARAPIPQ